MVVARGIPSLFLVALLGEKPFRSTSLWGTGSPRVRFPFSRRRWCRKLPFGKNYIFANSVDIRRTHSNRCRGVCVGAKLGSNADGKVEIASYVAIEPPFAFSLHANQIVVLCNLHNFTYDILLQSFRNEVSVNVLGIESDLVNFAFDVLQVLLRKP